MYQPVEVAAPAISPVTLDETKRHLRVDQYDAGGAMIEGHDDPYIQALIDGAAAYLNGWQGILGACLVEQTWRQDYDTFCRELPVQLGPLIEVLSITWRNSAGQLSTVNEENYSVTVDLAGNPSIRFRDAFSLPADLYENRAVSIIYKAGYPNVTQDGQTAATSTVPSALKVAILMLVAEWFNNREASAPNQTELPFAVNALIAPFRRIHV